jgi:hypothetical protein
LEKHHASQCHQLLASPTTNICSNLTPQEKLWITGLVTKAILSTDMALHRGQLEQMQIRVAGEPLDISSENDRRMFVAFILHAAGNTVIPVV